MIDAQGRRPLTAAEIGAFLGISSSAVRQIVRREQIAAVGKCGRAKVYWLHQVTKTVGTHDRQLLRKRRSLVSH